MLVETPLLTTFVSVIKLKGFAIAFPDNVHYLALKLDRLLDILFGYIILSVPV